MALRGMLAMAATHMVAAIGLAQQPYDLDQSFSTGIQYGGVGSLIPLPDGGMLISGTIKYSMNGSTKSSCKLTHTGTLDNSYYNSALGGGRLVPWNGYTYVAGGQTVRRLLSDGHVDPAWQELENDPYIHILQGGDYHVFPDGRLLITGTHGLSDSIRGFVGLYNLIWITADGQLDTTRIHRRGNGDLDTVLELPDGKFLIGGGLTEYEGHPVGDIIRVHPDGALDTTFHNTADWFWPMCFHPLPDGKVICGGRVGFSDQNDTLELFRLLPNGEMDPTFNNTLEMRFTGDWAGRASVASVTPLGADRYLITGAFDRIDEQFRGGIAVVDTAGFLLDEPIGEVGCGSYWDSYWQLNLGAINGILPTTDGNYYIFGSYHGYDDGTTNDASQRMVSRLYGLDVGVAEQRPAQEAQLQLYPNPAGNSVTVETAPLHAHAELLLRDALGRAVLRQPMVGHCNTLPLQNLPSGLYSLQLFADHGMVATGKLVIQH